MHRTLINSNKLNILDHPPMDGQILIDAFCKDSQPYEPADGGSRDIGGSTDHKTTFEAKKRRAIKDLCVDKPLE